YFIGNRTDKNNVIAQEMTSENMKNNLNSDTSFDFDSIDEINASGTVLSPEYIDESLIIGRLYIPSIEANLTVFNGVTNDILHAGVGTMRPDLTMGEDRKSTRLNSSHVSISYAVFCLKKKKKMKE